MPDDMEQVSDEADQAVLPTGKFRLYLGSAAGVGKTVAMLDEGVRRHERGHDIVIGFVETHNRPYTAEQIKDLEIVPRKTVEYRGSHFEEMDLDAVLVRHPEAALVDELAHTNVPGSGRNEKRWQDVIELLEADIAVVSTVNVQHLESIADAVERITGVHIREHVPDWVVRKADQIELIDSSPEQLRRRLLHGNVYPPDKIQGALTGFFRTENLVALRELALRFLADSTEDELLEYLEQHHPNTVWETAERILVSVTGAPGTDGVVRRAARMAARLKADLHVLNIRTADAQQPSSAKELEQIKYLVEDLGAIWHEAQGEDASRAIVEFAREHQITQILLGSSRRTRFEEIFKGSIVTRVLRFAAQQEIDVHVIARHRNKIEASTKDEH